jgi:hypothetical protein
MKKEKGSHIATLFYKESTMLGLHSWFKYVIYKLSILFM